MIGILDCRVGNRWYCRFNMRWRVWVSKPIYLEIESITPEYLRWVSFGYWELSNWLESEIWIYSTTDLWNFRISSITTTRWFITSFILDLQFDFKLSVTAPTNYTTVVTTNSNSRFTQIANFSKSRSTLPLGSSGS